MTTICHCSINSAKIYFSSVLIISRFRVLILRKLFANNIHALLICKSQDKMIMTSFSLFHCSKCQTLGTSSCSLNFSDGRKHQHEAKLGSDGSSDDWRISCWTRIWSEVKMIYSIFALMWFANRWNKCELSEASRIIADWNKSFARQLFLSVLTRVNLTRVSTNHISPQCYSCTWTTYSARLSFTIHCNCDFPLPSCCSTIVSLFIVSHAACSIPMSWLQLRTAFNHL